MESPKFNTYYYKFINGVIHYFYDHEATQPHDYNGTGIYYRIDTNEIEYRVNGKLHREDGPAYCGHDNEGYWEQWYVNGLAHREDGPAITWPADTVNIGPAYYWYYTGKPIDCNSQEEFEKLLRLKAFW